MQRSTIAIIGVVMLTVSAAATYAYTSGLPCQTPHASLQYELLFQESTYNALEAGNYNWDMTLKDLRAHGDFGVGTFDALDGEMVLLNGTFYQIKSDANVYLANDSVKSPFADVTSFVLES